MHSDMLFQLLMFVPVLCVRPVGMNMIFFKVLVLVNMRLVNDSCVFVDMMNIFMIVQMRVNFFLMYVWV